MLFYYNKGALFTMMQMPVISSRSITNQDSDIMNDYETRIKNREYERQERRKRNRRRAQIWIVIGVVVLIALLFFWVDIADIAGWGDGAA